MSRLLAVAAILFLVSVPARAQTATVSGTVNEIVGDQYYPIPFAKVALSGSDVTMHPVVPDIEGKFTLEAVPAGVYTLDVSAVGFASLRREIQLTAGDTLHVRIRLGDQDIAGIMLEPDESVSGGQRLGGEN